jgi:site-specific DNA-methyltransferase (adenine-specific)
MADNSVDSIVTDPPYGLSFMGKKWDYDVPGEDIWRECLRVLKPGGHLLAFAGTRTQHRMAVRIEDAGFEIRDMIAWVYGSGFPKSLNVGKVLDKFIKTGNASWNGTGDSTNGALGYSKLQKDQGYRPADYSGAHQHHGEITEEAAKKWQGWGTALKPAMEPITVARKPLDGTVAANVQKWGCGCLNIDGCRVGVGDDRVGGGLAKERFGINGMPQTSRPVGGRWPANLIHDGSDEVVGLFPQSNGAAAPVAKGQKEFGGVIYGKFKTGGDDGASFYGDSGSAARFFYCAKASKKDRDEGCEGMDEKKMGFSNGAQLHGEGYDKGQDIGLNRVISRRNHHPTVKPTDLMRYLCRLVTPPGGIVLDPFAGSGSTGKACALEGFRFIGIEREAEYCEIARARIAAVDVGLFGAAL